MKPASSASRATAGAAAWAATDKVASASALGFLLSLRCMRQCFTYNHLHADFSWEVAHEFTGVILFS